MERIKTAHCIKVVGGSMTGVIGSSINDDGAVAGNEDGVLGSGGGSANSKRITVSLKEFESSLLAVPSDTGRSSTTLQFFPPSGSSTQTTSCPSSDALVSTTYVHALNPVSLFPVRRSKSYRCHGHTATTFSSISSISAWDMSAPRWGHVLSITKRSPTPVPSGGDVCRNRIKEW